METNILETRAGQFFWWVTKWPKTVLGVSVLAIAVSAAFLPRLAKDASAEAFIDPDDPIVLYRNKVKQIFGLADPMVVLVVNDGPTGVFNPHTLHLIDWLTRRISQLQGVRPDRVTSLATEKNIVGTTEGIVVAPFFEEPPTTQGQAEDVRRAVMDLELCIGNLVSGDGRATAIVAELMDETHGSEVYQRVLELAKSAPTTSEQIHVAGEGAISAHLGAYIDADMLRLNLLCVVVITAVLWISYRTASGVLLPLFVVAGAVLVTLGSMAAARVPYYIITNALPVILVAIGVTDAIHIIGQYYEEAAHDATTSPRHRVVLSMAKLWQPATTTSVTDMVGFGAIYLSSSMPPMKSFGLFAVIGSIVALLWVLLAVPACMVLLPPHRGRAMGAWGSGAGVRRDGGAVDYQADWFGRFMATLGQGVGRRPGVILAAAAVVSVAGLAGVTQMEVNERRIRNFKPSEPIYVADMAINQRLNGSNYLDIVVETARSEGLFLPENLRRIEALQDFLRTLAHVKGATSIVDYLKQINRAANEGGREAYRLPESEELVAQYVLLYSASGNPDRFAHLVDHDYRLANVRITMDSGLYSDEKVVVENAQRYIQQRFNRPELTAHLAGQVSVDYSWIKRLSRDYFQSEALALLAVWAVLAIAFRSAVAGLLAVIPITMAILLIHAVMGFGGIWLSMGTSMFAAIAIGTGVNFAIHCIEQMTVLVKHQGRSIEEALALLFPSTGRALLFNFSAIFLGFGLLVTSHVPPLVRFGVLVTVSIGVSFLASVTVLPALIQVWRPGFLGPENTTSHGGSGGPARKRALSAAVLALLVCGPIPMARAEEPETLTGDQIAQRIVARDDGRTLSRTLTMELIDRAGKRRTRVIRAFRKYYEGEKRTVMFFVKPQNIQGTAFLNFEYDQPDRDEDRWLYLPALRKARRISTSNRGEYFLGTDFTYEDISNETKINIKDYARRYLGSEPCDGYDCLVMEALPLNERIAQELGYDRVVSWVDPQMWMIRKTEYWDRHGEHLKTIYFRDIRQVQGIWTAHRLEAHNHQTGHRTLLISTEVDYQTPIDDDLFTLRALERGP
jgi:hypothetical protein